MSTLAACAIEQLIHLGIHHFCICPGSRSTPLTLAVARHPKATSHIFHDERSAAFCALGFGKSGTPAVLITTSGTAVANALPAVVEANLANIPLLLMTADRPPELRSTNANQTIDQIKLFSDQVRFFFDIPCASEGYPTNAMQNTVCFAVSKTMGNNAGPVHLNWMFREPFDLTIQSIDIRTDFTLPTQGLLSLTRTQEQDVRTWLEQSTRGLVMVGELTNPDEIAYIQDALSNIGWPIIVDASSGLSLMDLPNKILAFEDVLRSPPTTFSPDLIVHVGNGLCTKRYELWLQTLDCPKLVFNSRPILSNPSASPVQRYQVHLQSLDWLCSLLKSSTLIEWVYKHNARVLKGLQQTHTWNEVHVLQHCIDSLPDDAQLFIGNSMPIRDLNNYVLSKRVHPVASNRGASGIDGIPSTALGWLLANDASTLLVLGDLSLMHDWGVLFTLKNLSLTVPFVIVVINNSGGGIFGMLPVSKEEDVFDSHFATVHTHRLAPIANSMGISTYATESLTELDDALQKCWTEPTVHIIEATVDRSTTQRFRTLLKQYSIGEQA